VTEPAEAEVRSRAISAWVRSPAGLLAVAGGPPVWLTWGMQRPAWLQTHRSDPSDWYVALIDEPTGEERARLHGPRWICTALAFSPDGGKLAAGSADHRVYVWDVATTQLLKKTRFSAVPISLHWSGDDVVPSLAPSAR
jgi:WD40 repeat protein